MIDTIIMSSINDEIDPICPTGYIFDKTKCECVLDPSLPAEIEPTCPEGYTFNHQLCQCEKITPDTNIINQQAAMNFIRNSYKPAVQMLEEAPNFNVFWLWNDQLLGQIILRHIDPSMANTIEQKMNSYGVQMHTPWATLDPKYRSNFSVKTASEPTISSNPTIRYSDYNGSSEFSFNDYADIAFLSAIHYYYLNDMAKAQQAFNAGKAMWDGVGMKDKGSITGDYALYKTALGLLAEKITKFGTIGIPANYFAKFQNANGGITTDITNGQPAGSQNIETTVAVLLALNPSLLPTTSPPPPPPPPPPTGGGAFRFNEGSDFRDTPASGDNLVSDKPDLILMNGDYGVNTDTPEEWCNNTMKMIKDSNIPVWGSLGNHDDEDGYLSTGFFQNKSWSWLLKKSMIAFVAADTNAENVSETDALLQQAQNDPAIKKIIVLMHESPFHPPNTSVSSDTTLEFHEIFKKNNKVKMVFTGHTHVYGRMNPIDGIMYLMCGIGGQNPSSGPTTPGPMHKINGVIKCAVSEDSTIKCECVPNKGAAPGIMDTFTIGPNGELPTDGVVGERRD